MAPAEAQRSQLILRLPVDRIACGLVMADGTRMAGSLFLPPSAAVTSLLEDSEPFLPVLIEDSMRLVARAAIAAIALPVAGPHGRDVTDELARESQHAAVVLRCGTVLCGELRWCAPEGRQRTIDFLNQPGGGFVLHGDTIHLVAKAHVAWVEEV